MWFGELAQVENPGRGELNSFVHSVMNFLGFVLEEPTLGFLWEDDSELHTLARETFELDVSSSAVAMRDTIPGASYESLIAHGLVGRPMRFKFRVMDTIGRQWGNLRDQFSVREWFRRIVEAIDAALGSLIDALGGVGGLIQEFKDALLALAKSRP